jgi:riboflavin synthase
MYTELKNVNPNTLNGQSTYDYNLHLPIPTYSYIRSETGIDLIIATGTEQEASSTLKFLTRTAMNAIKANVITETRNTIEFLIAKNKAHREAFLSVVAFLVLTTKGEGLTNLLKEGETNIQQLSKVAQLQAEANNLLVQRYNFTVLEVRSDY